MIEDIKKIKIYGGIGQSLIVFSVFIFPILEISFKFISDVFGFYSLFYKFYLLFSNLISLKFLFLMFIIGNILIIYSVKNLTDIISQQSVFKKFFTFYFTFLLTMFIGVFLAFLFLVLALGSALSDQVHYGMNEILITIFFLIFIIFLTSFYFYRRALLIIFQITNQNLFKIAGNLCLLGSIFFIIGVIGEFVTNFPKNILYLTSSFSLFLIFLGLLLPVIGFFKIKEVYNPNLS